MDRDRRTEKHIERAIDREKHTQRERYRKTKKKSFPYKISLI